MLIYFIYFIVADIIEVYYTTLSCRNPSWEANARVATACKARPVGAPSAASKVRETLWKTYGKPMDVHGFSSKPLWKT
jgi:hypothetical protein